MVNGGQRPDFGGQRSDSLQIYILGISIPNAWCMQNLGSIRPLGAILRPPSLIKRDFAVPLFEKTKSTYFINAWIDWFGSSPTDTELLVDIEFECGYGFSDLSLTIFLALKDTKIRRLEIKRKPVIMTIKFYFIIKNIHCSLLLNIK